MEKNIFQLDNEQLKEIARSFKAKVEEGLNTENAEIQCIPTFITPKASSINGKSLVLDLGGTNYRVAIVDFSKVPPTIHPNNGWKKDMSVMKSPGYTREELFKELADMITGIKREKEMPIGYCFSYPTESVPSGDAKLLRWTKGVDIKEMIGEVVGKPLLDYLNERNKIKFTNIKVLNDTVASLFAGLTDSSYDAYIGLIVGTGTNMATFIPADKIKKLSPSHKVDGLIPVNLESGNFHPPFLTAVDNTVDVISDNPGRQRFEKAAGQPGGPFGGCPVYRGIAAGAGCVRGAHRDAHPGRVIRLLIFLPGALGHGFQHRECLPAAHKLGILAAPEALAAGEQPDGLQQVRLTLAVVAAEDGQLPAGGKAGGSDVPVILDFK